jgi:hypothetical protein
MAWSGSWRVALALAGAVAVAGCGSGGGDGPDVVPDERPVVQPPDSGVPDAGPPDAGPPDAGPPDAGPPDAGPPDAGPVDAGPQPLPAQTYPSLSGWRFYGPEAGGPNEALDVSADQGGNIWVAGGEDGLFLLRKTASGYAERFERFTMEHGLRPYGYMADGSAPVGTPYLKVISVAGGPAGTVFVGYAGKPKLRTRADGTSYLDTGACESEANYDYADGLRGDASIYKSGDADRVTLTATGLKVVHYDISSGPGVVKGYPGREKVCTIHRLAYAPGTQSIWFGGNHGFARGEATYAGNPTCNGQLACSGVLEHVHPHVASDGGGPLTDAYFGIAPLPNGDVWFGGANRSVKFLYGTLNGDYWSAQSQTEDFPYHQNRIDIWPDPFYEVQENGEPTYYTYEMRRDDNVSGMVATGDGRVFVSSFTEGLKELGDSGAVLRDHTPRLLSDDLRSVALDSNGGDVWVGYRWGGGLSRLSQGGSDATHFFDSLGRGALGDHPVARINMSGSGSSRHLLVAFAAREIAVPDPENPGKKKAVKTHAGALGIYTGP